MDLLVEQFLPSAALRPFVKEFLLLNSDNGVASTALPDTSMVMTFRYKGKIDRIEGDGKAALPVTAVAGLRRTVRHFSYARHTSILLVVFAPGGISAFTRIPAHELFELHISSDNLFLPSDLNDVLEQLAEARTSQERINTIQSFLVAHLAGNTPDLLINDALHRIRLQRGNIKIKALAASLYTSQDALEKRFRAVVGATPKRYASIVRLRHFITICPSCHSLTDASYEAGYFDQSHFIKDFRLFTGKAPKDFFSSGQYW
jgi:AraC-like DNA-binding protein